MGAREAIKPLAIFDDFLPDPESFRKEAISLKHYSVKGPDGEVYKNVCIRDTDEFSGLLSQRLGRSIKQDYSLLRVNFAGESPNNAVHSDNGYSELACVLYLNLPEQVQGGTGFWRHKKLGYDQLPTEQEVRRFGKSPVRVMRTLTESWNDLEAWEQTQLAEMKFNRCIVYPSRRFHSRWPFQAFGDSPETARRIWCSFFSPA